MKLLLFSICGLISGVLNGLFGAGGGTVIVPLLRKMELPDVNAHATSIAVILPLSSFSAFLYLQAGHLKITDPLIFIPGGIAGAVVGSVLLRKIPVRWLRKLFGALIIFAAVRLLLK